MLECHTEAGMDKRGRGSVHVRFVSTSPGISTDLFALLHHHGSLAPNS